MILKVLNNNKFLIKGNHIFELKLSISLYNFIILLFLNSKIIKGLF